MKLWLLDAAGQTKGAQPLSGDETLLGRELIALLGGGADASVSRRHGRVFCKAGRFYVEDLGSRNGTFVNGVKLSAAKELSPGDLIDVGPHRFRFGDAPDERAAADVYESATIAAGKSGAPERLRLMHDLARLLIDPARKEEIAQRLFTVLARSLEPRSLAIWAEPEKDPIAGSAADAAFSSDILRSRVLDRSQVLRTEAGAALPIGIDPPFGALVIGGVLSDDDFNFAAAAAALAAEAMRRARRVSALVLPAQDDDITGESPGIQRAKRALDTVAPYADLSVLLIGETGTGKELFARRLHQASGRSGPFVPVNVAALPAELLEAELFGHTKGAFTGAVSARTGYFELAQGGTLFLDEIGETPAPLQAKLLRVLQEKTMSRLGDPRSIAIDVRVVAATNADLAAKIRAGGFREDLYYRLAGQEIRIPPLRDRGGDVDLLAAVFLRKNLGRTPFPVGSIAPDALALLRAYIWPGNVRQLESTLRLAVIHAAADGSEQIELEHIDERVRISAPPVPPTSGFAQELAAAERAIVLRALLASKGNKREAARLMEWSINTLRDRLSRYAITEDEYADQ